MKIYKYNSVHMWITLFTPKIPRNIGLRGIFYLKQSLDWGIGRMYKGYFLYTIHTMYTPKKMCISSPQKV